MTERAEEYCHSLFRISAENCVRAMFVRIEWRLNEHKIFETEGGFFGVGPSHIEVCDRIVFPLGMACPFAVRPYVPVGDDASPQQFTMIGCVETAGLLQYGILNRLLDQGALQVVDIELR